MFDHIIEKKESRDEEFIILIVEDSKVINNTLAARLLKHGFKVLQSYTLHDSRELLKSNDVSLVILDLHLPDGDGEELIEEINRRKITSKIIVLTSENDLFRRDELFRLGIFDYLLKGRNANVVVIELLELIQNIRINPKYTILVVDDSSTVRRRIVNILHSCDYKVLEAKSGEEALKKIQDSAVNLVLLDKELPGMDGLEVLKKIKSDEKSFYLPVFMVSSTLDIEVMRNAYKAGALDYFKKPFSPEELKLKVEQIIKQLEAQHKLRCTLKAAKASKHFFNEFYAGVIFDTNLDIREINENFENEFGEDLKTLKETLKHFSSKLFEKIKHASEEHKSFSTIYSDEEGQEYAIKLFILNDEEFLLSFEKIER